MNNFPPSSGDQLPPTEPATQAFTSTAPVPTTTRKSRWSRTLLIAGIAVIIIAILTATVFIVRPGLLFMTTPKTVTGHWSLSVMLSVEGLSGPGSLDLRQDGSTVKGTLKFQSGSNFDLKGTLSGQKIDLANNSGFGNISIHYELSGTVSDDFNQMSGPVTVTGSETLPDGTVQPIGSPPGTWSAKRA